MPRQIRTKWAGTCSKCGGKFLPGDTITVYPEEGKGYSKKSHHVFPECSSHTLEPFKVDTSIHRVDYFVHCLDTLKKIDEPWAREEAAEIAKIDVSSTMFRDAPVEFHALRFLSIECARTELQTELIRGIADHAQKPDVSEEARRILEEGEYWKSTGR